jgi:hypothetical protein
MKDFVDNIHRYVGIFKNIWLKNWTSGSTHKNKKINDKNVKYRYNRVGR